MLYAPKKRIDEGVHKTSLFIFDTARFVPKAIEYMKTKYSKTHDIKKMALTQLYALQRKHGLSIWADENDKPLDDFQLEYKPLFKFYKGILKVPKTNPLYNKITTSGLKDGNDDQLLIFIKKNDYLEYPSSTIFKEDNEASAIKTPKQTKTTSNKATA